MCGTESLPDFILFFARCDSVHGLVIQLFLCAI